MVTHADEFRVLYSNNYSQPIGYQFVSPSLSTYNVYNPAYRIFKTDTKGKDCEKIANNSLFLKKILIYLLSQTRAMIFDVGTYYFILTQANQILNSPPNIGNPVWKLEYSIAKTYLWLTLRVKNLLKL